MSEARVHTVNYSRFSFCYPSSMSILANAVHSLGRHIDIGEEVEGPTPPDLPLRVPNPQQGEHLRRKLKQSFGHPQWHLPDKPRLPPASASVYPTLLLLMYTRSINLEWVSSEHRTRRHDRKHGVTSDIATSCSSEYLFRCLSTGVESSCYTQPVSCMRGQQLLPSDLLYLLNTT